MIALYGLGISLLRYLNFPEFFEIREFSGDLHDHRLGEFLSYAGILHSSMPEDISGIFRRFTLWKNKRMRRVGSNSAPLAYYSAPLPLHHTYLIEDSKNYKIFFFIIQLHVTVIRG